MPLMAMPDSFSWRAIKALPRQTLMQSRTPLLPLQKLGKLLGGLELWCKRDDLISFGFGGNKIRGLEFLVADALVKQANVLVTGAGVQSNHVRATAATAAVFGLRCVGVFWGHAPEHAEGNYRITRMLNAAVVFTHEAERASVDSGIETQCAVLSRQGLRPYPIPRGGACALGALGHVLAAYEVYEQCRSQEIVPGTIVLATGSGGTHAGWLLGTRMLDAPWKIESFTVSREAHAVQEQIVRIANEAAVMLQFDQHFTMADVLVHGGFIGAGYGIPSREAAAAIRLVGSTEGLLLDPTYTGKAMAGLLDRLQKGSDVSPPILFIHTGGEPAFFAGNGDWLDN